MSTKPEKLPPGYLLTGLDHKSTAGADFLATLREHLNRDRYRLHVRGNGSRPRGTFSTPLKHATAARVYVIDKLAEADDRARQNRNSGTFSKLIDQREKLEAALREANERANRWRHADTERHKTIISLTDKLAEALRAQVAIKEEAAKNAADWRAELDHERAEHAETSALCKKLAEPITIEIGGRRVTIES